MRLNRTWVMSFIGNLCLIINMLGFLSFIYEEFLILWLNLISFNYDCFKIFCTFCFEKHTIKYISINGVLS